MANKARTEMAYRSIAPFAAGLCVGAAMAATTYHVILLARKTMSHLRNPQVTVETYYRLIDFWRQQGSPSFQFTCPARYKVAIMTYCKVGGLSYLVKATVPSNVDAVQTRFLVQRASVVGD